MIDSLGFNSADLSARWALLGGAAEEAAHNVYAMKVLFLGPFLFGQSTLSEQVGCSVCVRRCSFLTG